MTESEVKIKKTLHRWSAVADEERLTPEEVINAASEFFASVLLSILPTEKLCHETVNRAAEASHLFINENWRDAAIAQRLARNRK